jgi:hypothetical protein
MKEIKEKCKCKNSIRGRAENADGTFTDLWRCDECSPAQEKCESCSHEKCHFFCKECHNVECVQFVNPHHQCYDALMKSPTPQKEERLSEDEVYKHLLEVSNSSTPSKSWTDALDKIRKDVRVTQLYGLFTTEEKIGDNEDQILNVVSQVETEAYTIGYKKGYNDAKNNG